MKEKRADLPALTGLRFVAAASIVFHHMWPVIVKLNPGVPFAFPIGQLALLGMSLFFVMSGFIIHYNYSDSVQSVRGLYAFGVARFSRLYPLLFVVIAYDLVTGNYFLYQPQEQANYLLALPYMLTATQSWFYGFVGNHPIAFPYNYSNVTWSISTEFFLYLTYPVICLVAMRRSTARSAIIKAVVIVLVSGTLLALMQRRPEFLDHFAATRLGVVENPKSSPLEIFSDWFRYVAPYPRVLEFLTGCAIAQAHIALTRFEISRRERMIARAVLGVAVAYAFLFLLRNEFLSLRAARNVWTVGLLPSISIVIFCCARYGIKALSYAPIVALGEASYSMYLLHLIIIDKSAPTVFLDPSPATIAILIGRMLIILPAIVVLSLGMHRYFEVPAQRWLRRMLNPRRAIDPAGENLAGARVRTGTGR
jgi:peptidoglycan/LPS O-acetylase OafA/YrhL